MNLTDYLTAQNAWSARTFPNQTPLSTVRHVEKELVEIRKKPRDIIEWIDVATLSFSGAYIGHHKPDAVAAELGKQLQVHYVWYPPLVLVNRIEQQLDRILRINPHSLPLWIENAVLAFRGAFAQGYTTEQVLFALEHKQSVNFARRWVVPASPDEPWEHDRSWE